MAAAAVAAPVPGPILGLAHISLPVDDLDRAVRFYRDVLGADVVDLLDRAAWSRLFPGTGRASMPGRAARATIRFAGGPALQLFVGTHPRPRADDHAHCALAIAPTELAAFGARLAAAGVVHVGPVRIGPLGQASIYLHDPSGNLLELTTTGYTGDLTG